MEFAVLFLLVVLLSGLLLPALGTAGAGGLSASTVEVLRSQKVGSFETVTLKSGSAQDLLDWLQENGFPTPNDHLQVIQSYISEEWVFVAARVRKAINESKARIHPVTFKFKTDKPVYPMRLTGINNENCEFELFVFGDQMAQAPGWKIERCDRITPTEDYWFIRLPNEGIQIGHEYMNSLVSGAKVGTKLTATLTPHEMSSDVYLDWQPFEAIKPIVFSRKGAKAVMVQTWLIGMMALSILFYALGGLIHFKKGSLRKAWMLSGIVLFLLGFAGFFLLPKIEITSGKHLGLMSKIATTKFSGAIGYALYSGEPDVRSTFVEAPPSRPIIENAIQKLLKDYSDERFFINSFSKEPIQEEDSPGNYTLEERADGVLLKMFDLTGKPAKIFLFTRDGMERLDKN
jgi:hypothetical protein